ncbi:MAG: histidinol-phosphate transaminase [Chloroflexi bacterium]|nr:histidinol-phosphate transaminase [Chloroflexota bacterium]
MVTIRKNVAAMSGYVPGEQPRSGGWIKLNTNENVECSPAALEAIHSIDPAALRLYPDASSSALRNELARRFNAEPDQFVVGNGSDDILNLLIRVTCDPGDSVVYTVPSYSLYPVLSQIQGARNVEVPLADDFSLPVRKLCSTRGAVLFITNPNNPAGTWYPVEQIAEICESGQNLVVLDEAYADFSGEGCSQLVGKYPNVCVARSLSKAYGLAGLRVGYMFASKELAANVMKVKDSYNVSSATQIAAVAALGDEAWAAKSWADAARRRDRLSQRLSNELGLRVYPSRANFILVDFGNHSAVSTLDYLRERGILVRHFSDNPMVSNALRISIGSQAELDTLFDAIQAALKES